MAVVDISDIDVVVLIRELWKNQRIAAFFHDAPWMAPPEPSNNEIMSHLEWGRIDYIAGRCIKTDFSDLKHVNTRLYDRDAGEGTFERIIAKLRNNKN